jgi:hypothetical protein
MPNKYIYMENLSTGISTHIFRFLSHPVADAIRDRIAEFQTFRSSDLHTFYILFFLQRKLNALPEILDEMHDRMEIDSYYFRPSLWELYEKQFPGYFFPQH